LVSRSFLHCNDNLDTFSTQLSAQVPDPTFPSRSDYGSYLPSTTRPQLPFWIAASIFDRALERNLRTEKVRLASSVTFTESVFLFNRSFRQLPSSCNPAHLAASVFTRSIADGFAELEDGLVVFLAGLLPGRFPALPFHSHSARSSVESSRPSKGSGNRLSAFASTAHYCTR
jgi:hypothetical protein